MDIQACPRCASTQMHAPNLADGGIFGLSTTATAVCPDCSFEGAPLLFDGPQSYEAFRNAVAQGQDPAGVKQGAGEPQPSEAGLGDRDAGPGADDEGDGATAEARQHAELAALLDERPPSRPVASALFLGVLGALVAGGGAWIAYVNALSWAAASFSLASQAGLTRAMMLLLGAVGFGMGLAIMRIARRMASPAA